MFLRAWSLRQAHNVTFRFYIALSGQEKVRVSWRLSWMCQALKYRNFICFSIKSWCINVCSNGVGFSGDYPVLSTLATCIKLMLVLMLMIFAQNDQSNNIFSFLLFLCICCLSAIYFLLPLNARSSRLVIDFYLLVIQLQSLWKGLTAWFSSPFSLNWVYIGLCTKSRKPLSGLSLLLWWSLYSTFRKLLTQRLKRFFFLPQIQK